MYLKDRKQSKRIEKEIKYMHVAVNAEHGRLDDEIVSDAELIRRFIIGDESAFTSIVLKYQNRLLRVARAILGDGDEAMDMSQETFVKAYFNLKKFKGESGLYTWLYRILYNLCISSLRRKKNISFLSLDERGDSKEYISNLPGPVEDYKRREFRTALSEALKTLPLKQRTVFIMKQIDGMKHREIAHVMGITEGAVKSSYFHAVNKLKLLLGSYKEDKKL